MTPQLSLWVAVAMFIGALSIGIPCAIKIAKGRSIFLVGYLAAAAIASTGEALLKAVLLPELPPPPTQIIQILGYSAVELVKRTGVFSLVLSAVIGIFLGLAIKRRIQNDPYLKKLQQTLDEVDSYLRSLGVRVE